MTSVKKSPWTFLTNHAHVLLCLTQSDNLTMKDIAAKVGITERAVQRIIADLNSEGFVTLERLGRQNLYKVNFTKNLKHPIEAHRTLKDFIALIFEDKADC